MQHGVTLYCPRPRAFTNLNKSALKTDSSKRHQTLTLLDHDAWSCFVTASQRIASFKVMWVDLRPEEKNMLDLKEGHLEELGYKPFNESNPCATRVFLCFFLPGGTETLWSLRLTETWWFSVTFITKYSQTDPQPKVMLYKKQIGYGMWWYV